MKPYKTVRQVASDTIVIHKSRFIGYASPAATEEEALAFLQSIRQKHKDASHHCYAYIIGLNAGIMRYSDDVTTMLVRACLCKSQSDARNQLKSGAVFLGEDKIEDFGAQVCAEQLQGDGIMLKKGKKGFCRLVFKA